MKRFKTLISYTLLCVVLLSSCKEQVPVKNYKGAIVHKKRNTVAEGDSFKIEQDGKFLVIRVTKFDAEKYIVGDTIK
jgi:hypothetical protein